jgi:uncharacterized protein YjdB
MNRYFNVFVVVVMGILFLFSGCDKTVDVTGVRISPSVCVIRVGDTKQLEAIVSPDDADDKSVSWASQTLWMINPDTLFSDTVASVSESGRIKGIAEGCAEVMCSTTSLFFLTRATVYVGYAAAVDAVYSGSLFKNKEEIDAAAKIGIQGTSGNEARFGLPFLKDAVTTYCDVTVDALSEKMTFSGETTIEVEGVTTPVTVSGEVGLEDGRGEFEILVGNDTYSFYGTKTSHTAL